MSSTLRLRVFFRDLSVTRLWSVWTRGLILSAMVRRCKRDRTVREVLHCFRQNILRPRRTLLLSATAAFKSHEKPSGTPPCSIGIPDEDLAVLLLDLDGVEELSKQTLFCQGCSKRVIIDKKNPGVVYCQCKNAIPQKFPDDGWIPYIEADDVIIWRKEYKPGKGLYAYKVYGRFSEVKAQDFAAVQVDGDYRLAWDNAVAALSIVENDAYGVLDQTVLHWEVLWPRLFANRDYVYIRRHKEFDVKTKCYSHKDVLFSKEEPVECPEPQPEERTSVHSNAKRKSLETYAKEQTKHDSESKLKDNKVYVIVSKSCRHPRVPESTQVIRVAEYWSHMVVKSTDGPEKEGMEFVLTYYDEPAVGGMPAGVTAWASGRAAPAYLSRMRAAARAYQAWLLQTDQESPSFSSPDNVALSPGTIDDVIKKVMREQDMESSKQGPDLNEDITTQERSTQTETKAQTQEDELSDVKLSKVKSTIEPCEVKIKVEPVEVKSKVEPVEVKSKDEPSKVKSKVELPEVKNKVEPPGVRKESEEDKAKEVDDAKEGDSENDGDQSNGSWWRYLYPFYYFV